MSASTQGVVPAAQAAPADAAARIPQGARLRHFAGIASVLGGLIAWELISRLFVANPLFLAAPSQIVQAIFSLTLSGEMARHVAISAVEFALGYVIASVIGIGLGFAMASERLIEMLRSFGASPRQIFLKVSLPSAMPFILAGLKLGIGRGLIGVVVAELFGSRAGLGRLISQSADAFNMPELFAGVVVLAVAGIVMTAGFTWLEGRLVPWTKD
jgi:ABC-type nitrate/sulfonate/bicarbonate transport system permease component